MGDQEAEQREPTMRTKLAILQSAVEDAARRSHPWRILIAALISTFIAFGGAVAVVVRAFERSATREYVDSRVDPIQRDILEVLGWQRAIGPAVGVPRPVLITVQPRNPDGGTP